MTYELEDIERIRDSAEPDITEEEDMNLLAVVELARRYKQMRMPLAVMAEAARLAWGGCEVCRELIVEAVITMRTIAAECKDCKLRGGERKCH